jgi:hypothetical protein
LTLKSRGTDAERGWNERFLMRYPKFSIYIFLCSAGGASIGLQGCSSGRLHEATFDVQSIKAVEVGNPTDPAPEKSKTAQTTTPTQQTPITLSLSGSQLEEISRIEFNIERAEVWLINAAGKTTITTASRKVPKSELWTVAEGNVQGFSVDALPQQMIDAQKIQLALTFNTNRPGIVYVDGEQFEIEPQSGPLLIEIPKISFTSEANDPNTQLRAQIQLTKTKIFTPPPLPSTEPTMVSNGSRRPLYRLK